MTLREGFEVFPMDTELIRAVTELLRVAKGTDAEAACQLVHFAATPALLPLVDNEAPEGVALPETEGGLGPLNR
jgi:hypothetical protein